MAYRISCSDSVCAGSWDVRADSAWDGPLCALRSLSDIDRAAFVPAVGWCSRWGDWAVLPSVDRAQYLYFSMAGVWPVVWPEGGGGQPLIYPIAVPVGRERGRKGRIRGLVSVFPSSLLSFSCIIPAFSLFFPVLIDFSFFPFFRPLPPHCLPGELRSSLPGELRRDGCPRSASRGDSSHEGSRRNHTKPP